MKKGQKRKRNLVKQRICGLILIVIPVLLVLILGVEGDNGAGALFILWPIGFCMLFSKRGVMMFREEQCDRKNKQKISLDVESSQFYYRSNVKQEDQQINKRKDHVA